MNPSATDDVAHAGAPQQSSAEPATAPAIQTTGLTKHYGEKRALDGIDLIVEEGSIFGFLGRNGAGKTTTLRILTGLAHPSSGTAHVLGHDVVHATNAVRSLVGFLPDVPGFYEWMRADEFLRFAGSLFGIDRATLDDRIEMLLDLAGLAGVRTPIGGYSRGMRQRLGVAQALVNAPRLLMLDEPTSALDPIGRKEVLDMIAGLRGRTTVFFSTHILSDVERVCDTVAILDQGRIIEQSSIERLKARYGAHRLRLLVGDADVRAGEAEQRHGAQALVEVLQAQPWVASLELAEDGTIQLTVTDLAAAQRAVPAMVAERGMALKRFDSGEISLEEVFLDLVKGER